MSKKEALALFRTAWSRACRDNARLRGDAVAKQQEWNNFTDSLCKAGQITTHQYRTWVNPF